MKEFIKNKFPFTIYILRIFKIKKRVKEDYLLFKNNWLYSKQNNINIGYMIILDAHSLEKGMTSKNPRCFGINKVNNIISCINLFEKNNWEKDYAYNIGISILKEYCKFYEKNNWTDRDEYKKVNSFIANRKSNISTGVFKIKKKDFINDALIDYDNFLESRHSFREYVPKKISSKDMKKAANSALKTPTACNRQMCKIYYVKNSELKEKILHYSHGLTNFNNKTVNIIVITYDICSLCTPSEINQGMFNAGLVSMNFVNALHSQGIGSCFLEYGNDKKEEEENKKILGIPSNEKIAVVIAAGYYPEESTIPHSTRKPLEEIYREI